MRSSRKLLIVCMKMRKNRWITMTFIRSCWVYVEAPLRCPAPQFWQFRLSLFPLKEWYKAKSRSFVHYETSSQCTEGTLSSENVLLVAWLPLVVSLLYFGPKSLVYSKPKKKKKRERLYDALRHQKRCWLYTMIIPSNNDAFQFIPSIPYAHVHAHLPSHLPSRQV